MRREEDPPPGAEPVGEKLTRSERAARLWHRAVATGSRSFAVPELQDEPPIIRGSLSWVDWPKGGKPGDVSSISTSPHPGPARAAIPHGNDRIEKQACSLGAVAGRLQVTPRPTLIGRHTAAKASVSFSAAFPQ